MTLKKIINNLLFFCLIVGGITIFNYFDQKPQATEFAEATPNAAYPSSDEALEKAFENRQSDLQIRGSGKVVKILADDLKGSRHQRFILKLATGQTLLVAHNIDLARRINYLSVGDQVEFYGEYEWNPKGGVIHWTHHDPRGYHADGWLMHDGKTYK